jgi:phage nucleotide-binding protein
MKIQSTKSYSEDKLKILVFGEPGAGKTTLAKTIGEPTLIISAEAGLLCLNGEDIDVIDITQDDEGRVIPKEKRIARLGEAYQYLLTEECRNKYKWVFIDSLTEISQNLMEQLYLEFPDRKDSLVMYGENGKRMRSLIKSFRDIPYYNVVMTALSSVDKDENNVRIIGVSMVGNISEKVPAFFDEVFYLATIQNQETGNVDRVLVTGKSDRVMAKDRSGKLDKIEKPSLAHIASKIKGEKHD